MSNHLKQETSPYLLQHADNPVDWYPWCEAAFQKAKAEDKPVFLSIGYSTCHWCHVMARESFEDPAIAALLNAHFVPVKVDREERPDIDSIYMQVCQAYTGAGGWPTSIFMTADQKPFFAGTYFPKRTRGGMLGFYELLTVIRDSWTGDRDALEQQADQIVAHLQQRGKDGEAADEGLLGSAAAVYQKLFDAQNGGFGRAPKFPAPHNLLFLLTYARRQNDPVCLEMAEKTLEQMYRGGLFDHIGYGFCRYSTDDRFLVPHFEKMLYDNAWLILAYCKAYTTTKRDRYLSIAEQTAQYVLREMTAPDGGFYSAQDADSGGEEGAYYLFAPEELTSLLGKETGSDFNRHYGIFPGGNLKGKSIPNLLHGSPLKGPFDVLLPKIRAYRSQRYALHLDDKILTAWNGWMIAALCGLYRASGAERYRTAALRADQWLSAHLWDGNTLFVSFRDGKRGVSGFLDDYAGYLFAQLALHRATWDLVYLERAKTLCDEVLARFADEADGGFYFYEAKGEPLILRPKETYDGATPSGNALMAWNLVRLAQLTGESKYEQAAARQLDFLAAGAKHAPTGHAMFLLALLEYHHPLKKVTIVLGTQDGAEAWKNKIPADVLVLCLPGPTKAFALQNGRTTFYVCHGNACLPPVNELPPDLAGVQGEMAE